MNKTEFFIVIEKKLVEVKEKWDHTNPGNSFNREDFASDYSDFICETWLKVFNNQKREETMKINLEIAKICHQVNRDYCIDEQLVAPPKWDELPLIVQESIIAGVAEVIADPKITPTQIHQKWCDYKEAEGWKPGEVKNTKLKTHPNLVPFKDLPGLEKRKDVLFIRMVKREMKK